jgi:hypothetical protein
MNDPLILLKTIISGITIPPEAGGPAISYLVRIGWLDDKERTTAGELKPQYTIKALGSGTEGLDANGATSKYRQVYVVNVWCQTCGSYENAAKLNWKMVNELLTAIKTSRKTADTNTRYFEVINDGQDLTDGTITPPVRRTQILVAAHGFR